MRRDPGRAAGWTVALAVKDLTRAKSRLSTVERRPRAELVLSMLTDVLLAVGDCASVSTCLVVTPDARVAVCARRWGASVLAEPVAGTGLNDAWLAARGAAGTGPLALLMADLPLLDPADLARVLAAVPAHGTGFVADASGHGTVLLAGRDARDLRPRFGPDSARRHRDVGAADLTRHAGPAMRWDVDTAMELGQLVPHPRSVTATWFRGQSAALTCGDVP
jgi:2-phospho-L-lactate guanylyltransferase